VSEAVKPQIRRIGIAADSHGDWPSLDAWAAGHALDVVVHCGDCGTTPTTGVLVWAARGNHDPDEDTTAVRQAARPTFVDDYALREIAGLRWLFLGCAPGAARVAPLPLALPRIDEVDVLVSHESPFNPHLGWPGHPTVRALVERLQPRWCFSGHWHQAARTTIGRTRCYALAAEPSGWLVADVRDTALHVLDAPGLQRAALTSVR